MIRTVAERNELRPLVAGTVAEVLVRNNQPVRRGQPMIRLQTEVLDTNALVTGHQAFLTQEALESMTRQSIDILTDWEKGNGR